MRESQNTQFAGPTSSYQMDSREQMEASSHPGMTIPDGGKPLQDVRTGGEGEGEEAGRLWQNLPRRIPKEEGAGKWLDSHRFSGRSTLSMIRSFRLGDTAQPAPASRANPVGLGFRWIAMRYR
jgi:hypothetical protein